MTEVRLIGREEKTGRRLYLARVASLEDWSATLSGPEAAYVVFTALDARQMTDELLGDFARKLLNQGCVYSCSWGPDCERVHDSFDTGDLERSNWSAEGPIVMTTWHEDESLDEALWFSVFATSNDDFEKITGVLAISEGTWADEIESRLADCERWSAEALDSGEREMSLRARLSLRFRSRSWRRRGGRRRR